MHGPREVLLLLGGNEGDPVSSLARAEKLLGERMGPILARSRDHWTEPWGFRDDRLFLNRALIISTALPNDDLMPVCLRIEQELGRVRGKEQGPSARPIDIDILLIGEDVIRIEGLVVPHPRMHERAFALAPAADIAPCWIHPGTGRPVFKLLDELLREIRRKE
jgi:2-amino-4-hydroxy-6-hydroxymethyldihydropteridine diphosphokinase